MTDTSTILRGFNNHLFEFLDDIISIFPENSDLKTAKTFFEFTKKGNVTILIKMWHEFVYKPYGVLLEQGELEHFITKDYSNDLVYMTNSKDILDAIDKIRKPLNNLSDDSKTICLNYLNNLNKLSNAYNESK
jgi:hypothetical protein|tara:strand:- start:54 stop:452 length:399 start_codon:yes stop_codon:yes gene_type:complete